MNGTRKPVFAVSHRWMLSILVVVALVAAGGALFWGTQSGSPRSPLRQRAAVTAARTGLATGSVVGFGGSGADMWATTTAGDLYLTTNGGASWSQATLPVSLVGTPTRGRETSYTVAQYGTSTVWLVAPDGGQEVLFSSGNEGKTWSTPTALPTRTLSSEPELEQTFATEGTSPDQVHAQLLSADIGFIVLDRYEQATQALGTLELSNNGGQSLETTALPTFGTVSFDSPTDGFLAGGPSNDRLYRTSDGGQSWTELPLQSPAAGNYTVGLPLSEASASTVVVPLHGTVTTQTAGGAGKGGTEVYIIDVTPTASHAAGPPLFVSYTSSADTSVKIVKTGSNFVGFTGHGKHSYRSANQGESWTASTSSGLPSGWSINTVVSTGTGKEVATVGAQTCAGTNAYGKSADCTDQRTLYSTANAGVSWSKVSL